MNNRHVPAVVAGIAALVVLAYSPSLNNKFVNWDDDAHLLANPFVQSLDLQEIFTTTVNGIYIPLTSLSFALEYHFFKADPFIYHLDNLLLHLAVTVMVFLFCLRCGLSVPAALTNPAYAISVFIFIVFWASLWYFRKNRLFVFANLFLYPFDLLSASRGL